MFFKKVSLSCVYPYSELVIPVMFFLLCILFIYAILITIMMVTCRRNMIAIEKIRTGVEYANTRNAMNMRNMANERLVENNRVVRVMGSIVNVLKQ